MFNIFYHTVVKDDISEISSDWVNKIKIAIENKLSTDPETFGKPLRRSLKNYRKLRVGDYRVVFRVESKSVKIFAILHRSVVYKEVKNRI